MAKKQEVKKKRYTAKCFQCNKRFESDEMITHEHSLVVNNHATLTSKYMEKK